MTRLNAFRRYQQSMGLFSRDVVGVPLYPYQTAWADYVLDMVAGKRSEIVTVEMPRQSGKNETSAQLETAILAINARRGGDIVKTAPTWKPQIVNSKMRFDLRAGEVAKRLPWISFRASQGYIYRCGKASLQFLSADPNAQVVGATASLLMEVDEAQDVERRKFNKDFSPMRASTGAPIVAYGTPWTDDTLLENFKEQIQTGAVGGRVFRVLPDQVADANPAYGDFVDAEVRRLGREHPLIRTQYFLETLAQGGRLLDPQQLRSIVGEHERREKRSKEAQVVAGLDFAGADEGAGDLVSLASESARDSVALTIGGVEWASIAVGLVVPYVRILDRYEWINVNPVALHTTLYDILWNKWRVNRVHCDATGIGSASTAFLAEALNRGSDRVQAITFDGAWATSTRLAFQYLALVNGSRLKDFVAEGYNPLEVARQEDPPAHDAAQNGWWQRGHAKLQGRAGQRAKASVPDGEGHDDILISELLMVDAAHGIQRPAGRRARSREY